MQVKVIKRYSWWKRDPERGPPVLFLYLYGITAFCEILVENRVQSPLGKSENLSIMSVKYHFE